MNGRHAGLHLSAGIVVAGTAAAYALVGLAALQLALPPGHASPLYPSAGIALAMTLVAGWPALIGTALGAFVVNLVTHATQSGALAPPAVWVSAATAIGAMLQAAAGAWLVRRAIPPSLELAEPTVIARFALLGGPVACLVSAGVGVGALVAAGIVPEAQALENAATWWVGDTLGVLIGAPVALAFVAQPAEIWRPLRRTVALPLMGACALLAAGTLAVASWDDERLQVRFEADASALAAAAELRLAVPEQALRAIEGAYLAAGPFDAARLRAAASWWLSQPYGLQAIGYSVRIPRDGIEALESAARDDGLREFRVFERDASLAAADAEMVVIRLIEPLDGNAGALGVNALSIGAARRAIGIARDSGRPAATAGFGLTQSARDETGVVLYQALREGTAQAPASAFHGVVFVTLRVERMFESLQADLPAHLQWCLVDLDPQVSRARLAGAPGCESAAAGSRFELRRDISFGGRRWEWRVRGDERALTGLQRPNAWLFSVAGLTAAALLGLLLLLGSGRARRIESAVAARTLDLEREVAERRAAEERLRDGERRLRGIVDHVPIGVLFLDPGGRIVQANPRACEMFRQDAASIAGRAVVDLVADDDVPAIRDDRARLLNGEIDVADRRMRMQRADGSRFQARVRATALRDDAGRARWLVAVVEDITEHLRLEQAERDRDRAETASRMKSDFVSRMSHELRTPLNAMIGFAQLLGLEEGRQDPAGPAREWSRQIQRAGWHLLDMINETLDLARIESGALPLVRQPLALAPLVDAAVAMVAQRAAQRGIAIECRVGDAAVLGDETRLTQIVTNLLSNAVKYNRDGGSVRVVAQDHGDGRVALEVVDTGLGMTPSQLDSLFQPYNRLGREASGIEGTGLGLAISRRLAEMMDGTLEARSEAGRGSRFLLVLPAAPAPAVPSQGHGPPASAAGYRRRKVHYIEDNETNVEVMRGVLAQRPQIELDVSTLGLDGLAAVKRSRPDLILLDMQLPDVSGLELLRHLKLDDDTAPIPVVVVSADATPRRMHDAMRLGAIQYVTKPLDLSRFLQTVDEILDAAETRWG
ncbi:MAG: CHASE domain-containing protein [Rubrivivax sp.]|jgi:PAS domain S-box-containing protein|nr:CHASE domain-containing protein [Rubrivivax sp.]